MPEWLAQELRETKFDLMRFVRNFALFRIVLDLAFYFGHRALHVNERIYTLIVCFNISIFIQRVCDEIETNL